MDNLTMAICVAALLLTVSHWVTYELGKHTGKASALNWANSLIARISKSVMETD